VGVPGGATRPHGNHFVRITRQLCGSEYGIYVAYLHFSNIFTMIASDLSRSAVVLTFNAENSR